MANISLTLYINGFIGSVLMSPIQMGSLHVNNSVTNISRLGTFNKWLKSHLVKQSLRTALSKHVENLLNSLGLVPVINNRHQKTKRCTKVAKFSKITN
jgi:hypothetical protein